jgi:predicted phage terminase large subunit-like protein
MNSPTNNLPTLTKDQANALVGDYDYRRQAAKTLFGFCITYLNHYFNLNPAIFHRELIEKLGDDKERMLLILGFRGSAKSTFGSLALPLWAALEKKYNFILPIADTTLQAKVNIANIRYELETNELIRNDYGDMQSDEEWQKENILLANGVRILARSRGQKVRGLRHRQYRPELVVVDDPEDLEWVRTKENRDKTERWLRAEVIPALNERIGKLVLIGNQLHMDALLSRMKGDKGFTVLEYPLIDEQEHCLWPAKYPTKESLDIQRDKAGPTSWQREYLLRIVPEEGQEVKPEDIVYYDLPGKEVSIYGTGLDYAISKKETADYTSAVTGALSYDEKGEAHIDVMPGPVNQRIDMRETIEAVKILHNQYYKNQITFAEEVAYQKAANDEIERAGLPIERIHPSKDKRARLRIAATYIKNGTVRFPRRGCEDLLIQLFGFGSEEHDDLVDALVYMILGLVESGLKMEEVIAI